MAAAAVDTMRARLLLGFAEAVTVAVVSVVNGGFSAMLIDDTVMAGGGARVTVVSADVTTIGGGGGGAVSVGSLSFSNTTRFVFVRFRGILCKLLRRAGLAHLYARSAS